MMDLAQGGIRTSGGKKAKEQTGTANKKASFSERVSWKMCKHLLFFVLLFNCQTFVQPMRKVTQRPGYYSSHTVFYDGPNAPSVMQGLESAGYNRVTPGQEQCRFGSLLRMLTDQGFNIQQIPRRRPTVVQPPREQGRQGWAYDPFSVENLRGETQQLDNIRSRFNGMNNREQGIGGRTRRPNQVTRVEPNDSEGNGDLNNDRPRRDPTRENVKMIFRNEEEKNLITELLKKRGTRDKFEPATFHQENLDAHNDYRAKHGVAPLTLNPQMSRISQSWAEHLANQGSVYGIYHSDRSFRQGYGENIHASLGFIETGSTAVDDWYSEIKDYDFQTGRSINGKMIGHLTQLLWKTSQELGVGYAFSSKGAIFVVCHYNPPGNYGGQNPKNVPPVGGFSESELRRQAEEDAERRQMMFRPQSSFFNF